MSGRRYQTNVRLWLVCSAVVYVLLMAFGSVNLKGTVVPLWRFWQAVFMHYDQREMEFCLLIVTVPPGIVSLVLGWFAHALALVGVAGLSARQPPGKRPAESSGG